MNVYLETKKFYLKIFEAIDDDVNGYLSDREFKKFLISIDIQVKLRCDERFQNAFTACSCVFKVITLVWANQRNFFENTTTCSKRMWKTLVATQLKSWP